MMDESVNKTIRRSIAAGLAAIALLATPAAFAKEKSDRHSDRGEHWSDWRSLSNGYVGRRKVPENAQKPVTERRLENVVERPERVRRLEKRLRKNGSRTGNASRRGNLDLTKRRRDGDDTRSDDRSKRRRDDSGDGERRGRGRNEDRRDRRGDDDRRRREEAAVWLRTGAEGLYAVPIVDLAAQLDRNESRIRGLAERGGLSLTNAGQPVSWHFDESADLLLFAGERYETFHTDVNAYRLRAGRRHDARPMSTARGRPTRANGFRTPFRDALKFEEEPDMQFSLWAVASEPDADYWFWDYLYGGFKDVIEVALQVPDAAPGGTAQLRVTLRGWTEFRAGDDHQVHAELNGVQVGPVVSWDGFDQAVLVADFDQGLLNASGDNTLKLRNNYPAGTHPGQFLDKVEIEYSRRPIASDGSIRLHDVTEGVQTVSGFSGSDILVVEDPDGESVLRGDARVEADGAGGFQATFEAGRGLDYLLAERGALDAPLSLEPDESSALESRDNAVEYLIIAPRELAETAQALAQHRRKRFGAVRIAWLNEIYDEFSHGRENPFAITRFMERASGAWRVPPSYVVLVGKGSLDHKDRMGYSDSFLPTVMTASPWVLAASDHRLLSGDDGDAGFSFGRLPITSDKEGLAYVNKLAAYESSAPGDEPYQAVLAADNPDAGGEFHANSDLLADRLTGRLGFDNATKLYHPQHAVRQSLVLSSTWETGYLSYDGHGSATQVGDGAERFITAADADALHNSARPIFTALTCSAGNYTLPGTRSLAASLVLNAGGGAIASLSPSGESLDSDAQTLNNAFVDSLFGSNTTIGDAAGQAKLQTGSTVAPYVSRIYGIVGDPAVHAR